MLLVTEDSVNGHGCCATSSPVRSLCAAGILPHLCLALVLLEYSFGAHDQSREQKGHHHQFRCLWCRVLCQALAPSTIRADLCVELFRVKEQPRDFMESYRRDCRLDLSSAANASPSPGKVRQPPACVCHPSSGLTSHLDT